MLLLLWKFLPIQRLGLTEGQWRRSAGDHGRRSVAGRDAETEVRRLLHLAKKSFSHRQENTPAKCQMQRRVGSDRSIHRYLDGQALLLTCA
mmetsp:Transcript_16697/g.39045  ORF Transcript_16697/g.39045 Transcript_16697/m.39045 type:complete len:91 (+) Transcript_16697:164-436(+)